MTDMATRIDAAVERAAPEAPLLLDFDETLWLRNSTEAFLDSLRPRWLAALVLRVLDLCRPWMLLPGPRRELVWRDWLRVMSVVLVMPWSLALWRRHARHIAVEHWNSELLAIHRRRGSAGLFIVSNGFRCIIGPMLDGLDGERPTLLAAPLWSGWSWRRRGKRAAVEQALGAERMRRAVFVTDNDEDQELLAAVADGFHHRWPGAVYQPAMRDAYVPFDYIETVKRPGKKWFARCLLADELPVIILAYALFASSPWLAVLVLLFAHLSLWTIYEAGYVENDRVGSRIETDPVLSDEFLAGGDRRFSERGAWLYAFGLAAIGAALMAVGALSTSAIITPLLAEGSPHLLMIVEALIVWMVYLLAMRGLFHFYNHLAKPKRVIVHLLLQLSKTMGFVIWFGLSVPGAALLIAHAVSRWLPYYLYRFGRPEHIWAAPDKDLRLVLFLIITGVFMFSEVPLQPLDLLPVMIMSAFLLFRVFRERRALKAVEQSPEPMGGATSLV